MVGILSFKDRHAYKIEISKIAKILAISPKTSQRFKNISVVRKNKKKLFRGLLY